MQPVTKTITKILAKLDLDCYQRQDFILEVYYDYYWFIQTAIVYNWKNTQSTDEYGGDYNSDFFAIVNY